jgi:broad specificity phosphatase PhoE
VQTVYQGPRPCKIAGKFRQGNIESMDLILIRHGQVEAAQRGLFYGGAEVALSELGQAQAQSAADFLAGQQIDALWSSPLSRARFGAECVLSVMQKHKRTPSGELVIVPELREIDRGRWLGRSKSEVLGEFPKDLEAHQADPIHWRGHQGESLGDLQSRVSAFWERIQSASGRHVVVSHMFVTRCLIGLAAGSQPEAWRELAIPPGSVSCLSRVDGRWERLFVGHEPGETELSQAFPHAFPQDNPQSGI